MACYCAIGKDEQEDFLSKFQSRTACLRIRRTFRESFWSIHFLQSGISRPFSRLISTEDVLCSTQFYLAPFKQSQMVKKKTREKSHDTYPFFFLEIFDHLSLSSIKGKEHEAREERTWVISSCAFTSITFQAAISPIL
ncbi:hypothetical protein CDAR_465641 [Caerostris darwini]|uniref:Uncharacterized protein n=1 Tax=Caerostris darwini TaxID=1538125 RepID=A0AAV4TXR1_9ARAC|nr:hypothetical protein CDAR_465641 [Caerostris darwini]